MSRRIPILAPVFLAVFIAGCAPSVTVYNKTGFDIRVFIGYAGGHDVLSPSPGESSLTEVTEGAYTAAAVPAQDWLEYAKAKRAFLNDRLANSDKLTGPQLLEVVSQLKEIAAKMQQYESTAGKGAACSGRVSSDSDGVVEISISPDGKLIAACK